MKITYYFNEEAYEYEVSDNDLLKCLKDCVSDDKKFLNFISNINLLDNEEMLNNIKECYAQDYFEAEALDYYHEMKNFEKDPYGANGVNQKDFY